MALVNLRKGGLYQKEGDDKVWTIADHADGGERFFHVPDPNVAAQEFGTDWGSKVEKWNDQEQPWVMKQLGHETDWTKRKPAQAAQPSQPQPAAPAYAPPPPPPPAPPMQPHPVSQGVPEPVAVAQPNQAPDFQRLAQMHPAQRAAGYKGKTRPVAAPDFMAMANLPDAVRGQGYTRTAAPAAVTPGPQYSTADGAWMGEDMYGDTSAYAREWMATPNRYKTPWMENALDTIRAEQKRGREEGFADLDEWASGRGIVGSDIEGDQRVKLTDRLDENRLAELADLYEAMASVEAQDRGAAAANALNVGEFGRNLGNDRRSEGQFKWTADRTTARDAEDDTRWRSEFNKDENQFGASFDRLRDRDLREDLVTNADFRLRGGALSEDANRWRSEFDEDQDRYEYETDYRSGRDLEEDWRTRTGFNLEGGSLAEGANMNRANFGLASNNQLWNQGMDRSRFIEDGRRYEKDFGESSRRYNTDNQFRNRVHDETLGFEKDRFNRDDRFRYDTLGENRRQFDNSQGWDRERFFNDLGFRRDELGQEGEQFEKDLQLRGDLGRGGLSAQEKSRRSAELIAISDMITRLTEAKIPVGPFLEKLGLSDPGAGGSGGNSTEGEGSGGNRAPKQHKGAFPGPDARDGDTWKEPNTGVTWTYRDGKWKTADGKTLMGPQ